MRYRVTLNGTILTKNPLGLDGFRTDFVRDNEIFGIYSVSSFDLVFLGDGYCILRDLQSNLSTCEIPVLIEQFCNNAWTTILNGIIEVGSIEIDEELSQATCEIQDVSPIALISRNADVSVDLENDKDIFGNPIADYVNPFVLSVVNDLNGTPTNTTLADWEQSITNVLSAITGAKVNVSSNYLTSFTQDEIWRISFTLVSGGIDINSITIQFRDFQGNTHLIGTPYSSGNAAILEFIYNLNDGVTNSGAGIDDEKEDLQFSYDVRKFYAATSGMSGLVWDVRSTLPMEIESITIDDGGAGNTVTWSRIQPFVDGGNIPYFATYTSLINSNGPYYFTTTFKELMSELNKLYNVFFTATYNNFGEINLRIEDYQTFASTPINITFNNAKKLKVSFDQESAFNQISLGDASNTRMQQGITLTSDFCGIQNQFDATNSFILGASEIQSDMIDPYDDSKLDKKYILSNSGASLTNAVWVYDNGAALSLVNNYAVNMYDSNWHKLYRHLNKFRGNIIGISPYFDYDSTGWNVNITNNALNRLFRKYEFEENLTRAQFDSLIDNVFDKARFKRPDETTYRQGLIKSIEYNQSTGKALITILGE